MTKFKRNPKTGALEAYRGGKYIDTISSYGDSIEDFCVAGDKIEMEVKSLGDETLNNKVSKFKKEK